MIGLVLAVAISTGAVDPGCTVEQVCRDGYTKTVRPPPSYTNRLKASQLKAASMDGSGRLYEEDHFIPLELCGCPRCPENLWPQPWPEARKKDAEETRLHRAVCAGRLSLQAAQEQIRKDWKIHE